MLQFFASNLINFGADLTLKFDWIDGAWNQTSMSTFWRSYVENQEAPTTTANLKNWEQRYTYFIEANISWNKKAWINHIFINFSIIIFLRPKEIYNIRQTVLKALYLFHDIIHIKTCSKRVAPVDLIIFRLILSLLFVM